MKLIPIVFLALANMPSFAQIDEQIEIPGLKKMVTETKKLIREFEVDKSSRVQEIATPDYRLAHQQLMNVLKGKEEPLKQFLIKLNAAVKEDYDLIRSLRSVKNKSTAMKKTIEEAEKRFINKAESFGIEYQSLLDNLMRKGLESPLSLCVSVLCAEMIGEDIKDAAESLKKVNKKLKVEEATLSKASKHWQGDIQKILEREIGTVKNKLAIVSLTSSSQECMNLKDISLEDAWLHGVQAIATKGLPQLQSEYAEAQRLRVEGLKLKEILLQDEAPIGTCRVNHFFEAAEYEDSAYKPEKISAELISPKSTFEYSVILKDSSLDHKNYSEEELLTNLVKFIEAGGCGSKEELRAAEVERNLPVAQLDTAGLTNYLKNSEEFKFEEGFRIDKSNCQIIYDYKSRVDGTYITDIAINGVKVAKGFVNLSDKKPFSRILDFVNKRCKNR